MVLLLTIIFFALGLIVGSFLNVIIFRLNTNKSLGGRSACMSCRSRLSWYELIPLLSFLVLKGRCKSCKTKISVQYPLVELATGIIFAVLFFKFQDIFFVSTAVFSATYAYYAAMFSILVVISAYDLRHKIIPDRLSLLFGALAFAGIFFFENFVFYPHIPAMPEYFSGVLVALPFAFFWIVSRGRWMGLGDAKLALGAGWFLGLALSLSALVFAFWSGAVIGVGLVLLKNSKMTAKGMKSEIPFAPFLVLGIFIAFISGLSLFIF